MMEESEGRSRICILVTSSPESENSRTLIKISRAAADMGHEVQIFLMCDGVYHVLDQNFLSRIPREAEIILCAQNALERGVENRPGVLFGSQYDLAVMIARSDGFLALT